MKAVRFSYLELKGLVLLYHFNWLLIFFFLEIFRKVLITTIVAWAEETQIETPKLVREMFRYNLFLNQL